ncbi:hypothetical protein ABW19_dt0202941 [Dactylella cylindrospora]|nr:hypothetical protein ABW19_dt0202941 [Dactylella cylindrospora]
MSWLWSSSKAPNDKGNGSVSNSVSSGSQSASTEDKKAFSTLDPSLKDYFKHLTPEGKPTVPAPEPTQLPEPTLVPPPDRSQPRQVTPHQYVSEPPKHAQSAYGDRYAEYWQTYTGSSAAGGGIRNESSDQKMQDFVAGYKQLRENVGKAARENCAFEELELRDCYKYGTWWQTMRMCTEENHKLQRCMEQQLDFLKEMGYLMDPRRDPAIDERIQMHADKLYQMQKAQDEAADRARKEGRNVEEAISKVKAEQALHPTPDYTKFVQKKD